MLCRHVNLILLDFSRKNNINHLFASHTSYSTTRKADLIICEFLLIVVEGEMIILVLQVDPTITHDCQLPRPR